MASKSNTFDVYIAYNSDDREHAATVARILQSFGLTVFYDLQVLESGSSFEDVIWQAMAESYSLVVVVPAGAASSWLGFELGVARAWNKPIYAVSANATIDLPLALKNVPVLPISRSEEIARSIRESLKPITDEDRSHLFSAYERIGVTVDQLSLQPRYLGELVKDFNKRSGKQLSGEQIMWLLLRMRKQRDGLPPLNKRTRKTQT